MGKIRKVLIIILLLAAFSSGVLVLMDFLARLQAEREYEKLAEMVQTSEEETKEELQTEETEPEAEEYQSPIDFAMLKSINSDTVGWIQVPDTPIDYPIVQAEDNDRYLHTDFEGNESVGGAIFLDFESDPDLKGYNNILYGHHMKNGSMFKALVNYKDQEYFEDHPYFTIYTPEEEIFLRVIAAYYGDADPQARRTRFATDEEFNEYVDEMTSKCPYRVELEGEVESLYSLITCSYEFDDARTFVYAVPADEDGNILYSDSAPSEDGDAEREESGAEEGASEENIAEESASEAAAPED